MKKSLTIIRWIVGLLFIFSGLVKANDPLGLSYKMQEFFEVWGWQNLNQFSLSLALVMNVFEVIAGVAVIVGWRMRIFSWLLLVLIVFFCFLTAYAYITGNIKTCGCFGDCLPLTPLTSFIKDLLLLILILVLFVNRRAIQPHLRPRYAQWILLSSLMAVVLLQAYVLNFLPLRDCLPYRTGSNILRNMQVPEGALPDSFAVTFRYKKNGSMVEFDAEHFPPDFDTSYQFIERYQKLVRKGNGEPPITDFSLSTINGTDTTLQVLGQERPYLMLFANDFSTFKKWHNEEFGALERLLIQNKLPLFLVTSDKVDALKFFSNDSIPTILICDATVIKTAARVNPTYFIMQGATIKGKFSYKEVGDVMNSIPKLAITNNP